MKATKPKRAVMISFEAGSDTRISSLICRVPLKIYADDALIFEWQPPKRKARKGKQ